MAGKEKIVAMAASSGFCNSDVSSTANPDIQTHIMTQLQSSFGSNPEIYSFSAGTEMNMVGFPPKNLSYPHITENNSVFCNRFLAEDPSLKSVFPCEGYPRPSQGLSLSLSSSNDDQRFGPSSSRSVNVQQVMQPQFQIRNSKYLAAAQDLLNEFCYMETSKMKAQKDSERQQEKEAVKTQLLFSLEFHELQRRKTELVHMLEEVDRRYKHYCDQMKAVISSFEAAAGNGAATAYSAMASRAMSRHFRCLRDVIVTQIKDTKKAMEEKNISVPGTTKGETPRLRMLDQKIRHQRAIQQMGMMETHPWRPQRGLPEKSVAVLRAWLFEHFLHPYPSDVDKHILARQTGLSRSQVSNWFINARVRLWKPMVEEMYLEDLKEGGTAGGSANPPTHEDRKPMHDQLMIGIDSECLSSIVNNPGKSSKAIDKETEYGAMQFDFSSYGHHSAPGGGASSYLHENAASHNYGGGGGVSLTLGLQQQGESQSAFFYPRDEMEDCQTIEYSLFDSETQNLPYRNLMGEQLLRDLAG